MGYSPWPSKILTINKSRSMATVQYYGYESYVGKVKMCEMVQLDERSRESICNLVSFIIQTKSIKDFDRFEKGVKEINPHFMKQ